MQTIHIGPKQSDNRYVCDRCPRTFFKKPLYDAHMRRHKGLKAFKCEHCDREFQTSQNFRRHMAAKHYDESEGRPEFICGFDECGKTYDTKV